MSTSQPRLSEGRHIVRIHTPPRRHTTGHSEELLAEIAMDLEPEDGVLWVHDTEDGGYGFTLFGLESVQQILSDNAARYAGHLRLRRVEFTPTRLAFEIDRPQDRLVVITFRLGARRFLEIQRVVNIIFGLKA